MSEPAALDLALAKKTVNEWLDANIIGHGLWARYQEAREIIPALVDELERCRAERDALRADNDALRHIIDNAKAWNDELGRSNRALGEVTQ